MLSEEEFTKRYIEHLSKHFGYNVEQWMVDVAPDAYEMWKEDDPESQTPEDMADEEANEIRRSG